MSLGEWIGTLGVTLLLIAFGLNITKKVKPASPVYLLLNILGAALAAVSSYMIKFWPFVVLECVWVGASLFALLNPERNEEVN